MGRRFTGDSGLAAGSKLASQSTGSKLIPIVLLNQEVNGRLN